MQTTKKGISRFRFYASHRINNTTMTTTPKGIDVVGCDNDSNGRQCTAHNVCGHYVKQGDKLYCKWAVQQLDDGVNEACVEVHKLGVDGQIQCHVGYLQRRIVKSSRDDSGNKDSGRCLNGMWLTAIKDLRLSDSAVERQRSTRNGGMVYCQVIQDDDRFVGINPFDTPIEYTEEDDDEGEAAPET